MAFRENITSLKIINKNQKMKMFGGIKCEKNRKSRDCRAIY